MTNRLLARRQFILDVLHPGRANVPKVRLRTTQIARRVLGFCFVRSFQRAEGVSISIHPRAGVR